MTKVQLFKFLAKMEPFIHQVPPDTPLHTVAFLVAANLWIRGDDNLSYEELQDFREELRYFLEHKRFSFQD